MPRVELPEQEQEEKQPEEKGLRRVLARLLHKNAPVAPRPEEDEDEVVLPKRQRPPWVIAEEKEEEPVDELLEEQARRQEALLQRQLEEDNLFPVQGSRLYTLHCRAYGTAADLRPNAKFSFAVFMEDGALPTREQRGWLQTYERGVRTLPQYGEVPLSPGRSTDAVVYARIADDKMSAWLFVLPPLNGGAPPSMERVYEVLGQQNICFGVEHAKISAMVANPRYLTLVCVAKGVPAVPGTDGEIVDHYRRTNEIQLDEKEDSTIDYKDLGWLQTVHAGDVICDVIPPVAGADGMSVRNEVMRAKPGRKVMPPIGQATRLNEDGTALVAQIDGVLSFKAQRFQVEPLLVIRGDVDNSIGNLDSIGNIVVYGDIRDGFTVQATGNIVVQGMVEGAFLQAGGDIQIGIGVNGSAGGMLRAGGHVYCSFVESARVEAYGSVICDSAVNSSISVDGDVVVESGRGMIVGCNITALNHVRARVVGNKSSRRSVFTLGCSIDYLADRRELEEKRDAAVLALREVEKDIMFLNMSKGLSATEQKQMQALEVSQAAQKQKLAMLEKRIDLMASRVENVDGCALFAKELYPPAQVVIGQVSDMLGEAYTDVMVSMQMGLVHVQEQKRR